MQLNEIRYDEAVPVDGYGPGFFRVAGKVIEGPVVAIGKSATAWSGFDATEPFVEVAAWADFVLVGTGTDMAPVPVAFQQALEDAGLGVEPMPSPTACRTYNLLLAEGRRVILAALPV